MTRWLLALAYDRARRPADAQEQRAGRASATTGALSLISVAAACRCSAQATREYLYGVAYLYAMPRPEYALLYFRRFLGSRPTARGSRRAEEHVTRDLGDGASRTRLGRDERQLGDRSSSRTSRHALAKSMPQMRAVPREDADLRVPGVDHENRARARPRPSRDRPISIACRRTGVRATNVLNVDAARPTRVRRSTRSAGASSRAPSTHRAAGSRRIATRSTRHLVHGRRARAYLRNATVMPSPPSFCSPARNLSIALVRLRGACGSPCAARRCRGRGRRTRCRAPAIRLSSRKRSTLRDRLVGALTAHVDRRVDRARGRAAAGGHAVDEHDRSAPAACSSALARARSRSRCGAARGAVRVDQHVGDRHESRASSRGGPRPCRRCGGDDDLAAAEPRHDHRRAGDELLGGRGRARAAAGRCGSCCATVRARRDELARRVA